MPAPTSFTEQGRKQTNKSNPAKTRRKHDTKGSDRSSRTETNQKESEFTLQLNPFHVPEEEDAAPAQLSTCEQSPGTPSVPHDEDYDAKQPCNAPKDRQSLSIQIVDDRNEGCETQMHAQEEQACSSMSFGNAHPTASNAHIPGKRANECRANTV